MRSFYLDNFEKKINFFELKKFLTCFDQSLAKSHKTSNGGQLKSFKLKHKDRLKKIEKVLSLYVLMF